jgi:3',5'-cyclic-AMP phosphodiesterase
MKVIHVSDTHLVGSRGMVGRCDPLENFRAFVQHINTHHADAALCVITGDLVNAGELAAYQLLREELGGLRVPARLLIGNHDHRENFAAVFPEAPRDAHGFVQSVSDTEVGRFVFLDTHEPGWIRGHLCALRRCWLTEQVTESARPVYLFMHHPPAMLGVVPVDDIRLEDEAWLLTFLGEHRARIRHIFFGHTHLNVAGSVLGIPISCPRSTNHQTYPQFGPSDLLHACTLGPTYCVVLLSEHSAICHFVEYRYPGAVWKIGSYRQGYAEYKLER